MKKEIEQYLKVLIGLVLFDSGNASIQWFAFGRRRLVPARSNEVKEVGEYALHLACAWRIRTISSILVGSYDLYSLAGDPYQEVDKIDVTEPAYTESRLAERLTTLFRDRENAPLIVQKVVADTVGSVRLSLSGGYLLEVFPDNSLDTEYWRFFIPNSKDPHFVVTSQGVEVG